MMRSLFAGVSGLRNHQVQMDVIGNNIANVNTVGYKESRVTFEESLAQALRAGTRPYAGRGGMNPMFVGTGMSIGSIDKVFNQGNLERTGNQLDLAIQGDAFFVLRDANQEYFTRAGNFQVDSQGNLVFGNSGLRVQGRMADQLGHISADSPISDIQLSRWQKAPAEATSVIGLSGNLNSDTDEQAQTLSSSFATDARVVSDAWSGPITITAGSNDTLQFTIDDDAGGTKTETITLADGTYNSLSELVAEINSKIQGNRNLIGEVVAEADTSGLEEKLIIRTVDEGGGNTELTLAGSFAGGGTSLNLSTARVTGTSATTKLSDLPFLADYLTTGDEIRIVGTNRDGVSISSVYSYTDGDTVQDLIDAVNSAFPDATVSISETGQLKISDAVPGQSKLTASLSLKDTETANVITMPQFSVSTVGRDAGEHTTSITVYDSKGNTHTVDIKFSNISSSAEPDLWHWQAIIDDGEVTPISGSQGTVKFNPNGSLASFEVADGQPLTFSPGEGTETMEISLQPGSIGGFDGITQLKNATNATASSQDGYGMGDLYDFSFDDSGKITGYFTNGVSQVLGQLALATFNNPAGLEQTGENTFAIGANSGMPVRGWANETIHASIAAGQLEMSNVDLAQEFTNMIVAQRGFQANARVITTSDTLLEEVVRLKR